LTASNLYTPQVDEVRPFADCLSAHASAIEKKAMISQIRVEHAIYSHGVENCAIACSFGKDSMVVLHMALKVAPDIPVVWCDTKCENKFTYEFQKEITEKWKLNLNIARAPKGVDFWTIAKEYGMPKVRGEGKAREPKCCELLKNAPSEEVYTSLGTKCIFTGVTADESRQRFMLMARNANKAQAEGIPADDPDGYGCGAKYYGKMEGRYKVMPIIDWTEADVWAYHDLMEIPHCKVYDTCKGARVGCDPCTAYKSWMLRMPLQSPKTYEKVRKMKGISVLSDFEEVV